jgi:DNA-binding NtrC family response regulator
MTGRRPIRVLVVDDEPSIRESLARFLDDYDFEVSAAQSAEDALELCQTETHDVAVVDLRLPGMSGENLILHLSEKEPSMCFLLYTGSVDYRLSEDLKRVGIGPHHVFLKPLSDLTLLVEGIRELLGEDGDDALG